VTRERRLRVEISGWLNVAPHGPSETLTPVFDRLNQLGETD
jgi:hypothetical protein